MEGSGAILVVSGFGRRREEVGGGRVIPIPISGTAVPDLMEVVPITRRIATGGHYHVLKVADARIRRRLPVGAIAALMVTSTCVQRTIVKPEAVNATTHSLMRRRVVSSDWGGVA
jgi:hypothetical protein